VQVQVRRGTRTLTVRRLRGTARIVITVPSGDVIRRRV
jgi:hypothetical protein